MSDLLAYAPKSSAAKTTLALAASVCLFLTATASAEPGDRSSAAFLLFGLPGVWSPDCKQPPAKDNPRVVWRVPPNGPIFHGVTFDGTAWALIDTVTNVAILTDDTIRFSSVRDGRIALTATVERVGERIHTTLSVSANGHVYVRDGIELSTGKPSLFDERCDGDIPLS